MDHIYPTYFKEFGCVAAACPDSCCQGWDVVIDSDTEAFYHTVPGDFGAKLKEAIFTDADGDRVFRLTENKKCPFWGEDKLCDIYRELGEEHLCATCAQYPRLTMAYADFTEHMLALSCPEAARLILSADNAYADFTRTQAAGCEDYDARAMCFLLQVRTDAAAILSEKAPLAERLLKLLSFAIKTQQALTGEIVGSTAIDPSIYGRLEYIDEDNRRRFTEAAALSSVDSRYGKEMTDLALYWLYRYFLSAVDTGSIIAPIRFVILSVREVAALAENEHMNIVAAAQLYSKEIEQSYENMEALGM